MVGNKRYISTKRKKQTSQQARNMVHRINTSTCNQASFLNNIDRKTATAVRVAHKHISLIYLIAL